MNKSRNVNGQKKHQVKPKMRYKGNVKIAYFFIAFALSFLLGIVLLQNRAGWDNLRAGLYGIWQKITAPKVNYSFKSAPGKSGFALLNENKQFGFSVLLASSVNPKIPQARFEVEKTWIDMTLHPSIANNKGEAYKIEKVSAKTTPGAARRDSPGVKEPAKDFIVWKDAIPSADVRYQVKQDGLKEEIILKDKNLAVAAVQNHVPLTLPFNLTLSGVIPRRDLSGKLGGVFIDSKTGEYRFHFETPFMVDAKGVRYEALEYELVPLEVAMNPLSTGTSNSLLSGFFGAFQNSGISDKDDYQKENSPSQIESLQRIDGNVHSLTSYSFDKNKLITKQSTAETTPDNTTSKFILSSPENTGITSEAKNTSPKFAVNSDSRSSWETVKDNLINNDDITGENPLSIARPVDALLASARLEASGARQAFFGTKPALARRSLGVGVALAAEPTGVQRGSTSAEVEPQRGKGSRYLPLSSVALAQEDRPSGSRYLLVLKLPRDWLADPARAYPVIIDPTITHNTQTAFATGTLNRVKDEGSADASPALTSSYHELPADINTVGLWHMNEASGTSVADSSGNANTGTATGTTVAAGKLGNARSFNGTSDNISITDSASLNNLKALTIESWIYPTTKASGEWTILSKGNTNNSQFQYNLRLDPTRKIHFIVSTNGTSWGGNVTGNTVLSLNQWYHIVGVWDGSSVYVYLNGVSDATPGSLTGTIPSYSNAALIGVQLAGQYFAGTIDEIRISNVARTPEELKANSQRHPYSVYTSPVVDLTQATSWTNLTWLGKGIRTGDGETPISTTGLVAQWNFNETSLTTAASGGSCGAACNGTLTNFLSTASQDQAAGTGWTANNKRWGAGALMFDGTNDVVTVGDNSSLDIVSNLTIEAWVKRNKTGSTEYLVSKGGALSSNASYIFYWSSYNKLSFYIEGTASTLDINNSGTVITDGNWHHVVSVYVPSSSLSTYIDGVLNWTTTSSIPADIRNSTVGLGIGAKNDASVPTSGVIDSTRIYSRALTAAEILANYQAGNIEFQTRTASTVTGAGSGSTADSYTDTSKINTSSSSNYQVTGGQSKISPTQYSKTITVSNSGSSLTNYPVLITTDTASLISASKMRSDCGDIRVTDADGSTQLSYWVESGCNSSSTKIWTKIPSVPNGSKDIYLLYGNLSNTSQSNGDNTFDFFDDFPGTSWNTSKWTHTYDGTPGSITVSNSILTVTAGSNGENMTTQTAVFNQNKMYEVYSKQSGDGSNIAEYINTVNMGWRQDIGTSTPNLRDITRFGGIHVADISSATLDTANYHIWGLSWRPNEQKWWRDGANLYTDTNALANTSGTVMVHAFSSHSNYVDWVRVRQYSSPEPTISVGTEQNTNFNTSATIQSTNLLSGATVSSLTSFVYNLSAKPASTTATVQFSTDGSTWTDSAGSSGQSNTLTTGTNNTITIGFPSSGILFYKVSFTGNGTATPVLDDVTLNYTTSNVGGYNWEAWKPTTSESQLLSEDSPLSKNLISYWKLDETSGTRKDSWGTNDLADNATVTSNPGKVNIAGQFTAANSEYLSIADNAALSTGNINFTISAWIYLDSKSATMNFVKKTDSTTGDEYYLRYIQSTDRFDFGVNSGQVTANTYGSPSTGVWIFLVGWLDSSTGTVYISVNNGTPDSTGSATGTDTAYSFFIGSGNGEGYMNGRIDEVAFWKRVLTADERSTLYNSGAPQHNPDGTDLTNNSQMGGIRSSSDTTTKIEGTGSEKLQIGAPQVDGNTVGLWHMDETSGTGAYIKDTGPGYTTSFATGGTITTSGGYTIHTFTSGGTFTANASGSVDYLIVGGGGGGGTWAGGGGGGGGGIRAGSTSVTATGYTVTIGGGGGAGGVGGASSALSLTANGGGNGGGDNGAAGTGGSGGGGGRTGGSGAAGNQGGNGGNAWSMNAGGGGGGGGNGANGVSNAGGAGGIGYSSSISGAATYYAGGGGGGAHESGSSGGAGGQGGGGAAATGCNNSTSGTTNTGGGGGGASGITLVCGQNPGNGGSGIVIIRYPSSQTGGTVYNHGTPTGTTVADGFFGKARSFNGTSDTIDLGTNAILGSTSTLTFEFWIKPNSISGTPYPLTFGHNTNWFEINPSGTVRFGLTTGAMSFIDSIAALQVGKWFHVAGTYDGSNMRIYIDGAQSNSAAKTGSINDAGLSKRIGSSGVYFFNGSIDEVRISNVARTAEEIAEAYRAGRDHRISRTLTTNDLSLKTKVPFYVASDRVGTFLEATIGESAFANYEPDANTVGLWHLEEQTGSGAYVLDSSSNNNRGTPTGTTFVQGKLGKGRDFNGTSDYISMGTASSLAFGTGSFSFGAWTKTSDTANYKTIISKGSSNAGATLRYYNRIEATSGVFHASIADGTNEGNISCAGNYSDGNWHHLMTVVDRSSQTMINYVDGVRACSTSISAVGSVNSSQDLRVGILGTQGYYYKGTLDEVIAFNRALTADEIRQQYEIGKRTHPVTIDFVSKPQAAYSTGTSVTILNPYGTANLTDTLKVGDTIIFKENVGGTETVSQAEVNAIVNTASTYGTVTLASAPTFPTGGYTTNATVFKWQREYFDIKGMLASHVDAVTRLTWRVTDGSQGSNVWLDDFVSNSSYLSDLSPDSFDTATGIGTYSTTSIASTFNRYFQYRAILSSWDTPVSPQLTSAALNYVSNNAPGAPTISAPLNAATQVSLTPVITLSATDADLDYLRYKVQLATDAAFSVGLQTFDQTASQAGWSGQNAQTSTAYTSGTTATYTIQSALVQNTVYYIRAYAVDPAGINVWGSASSTISFTTTGIPAAPAISAPTNGATGISLTPLIQLSTTDPQSDYLRYKLQLATDTGFTANLQTFDQTASQTGWSGQNAAPTTPTTNVSDTYTDGSKINAGASTNYVVTSGQIKMTLQP